MISRELEAEIVRLYHAEHWPVGTLARQLHIHHETVRRVLGQAGIAAGLKYTRASMVEPFLPFILETLGQYPTLRASRLYQMVRERGYPGAPDHFRAIVARYRPRPQAQAYLRLRTLPSEEGQVDWAHFGKLAVGRATRPLMAFVMVLSYSRHLFLRFYLGAAMSAFSMRTCARSASSAGWCGPVCMTIYAPRCSSGCRSRAPRMRSASIRR